MRSAAEWLVALALVWLGFWVALPWLRSLAPAPEAAVTLVESALPDLPSGVPLGAESVPVLILDDGLTIRVGMAEQDLRARTFAGLVAAPARAEAGVLGPRTVLPLRSGGSRFWVVLDRTAVGREREVTAIYVN
jgi:hypothetical protein